MAYLIKSGKGHLCSSRTILKWVTDGEIGSVHNHPGFPITWYTLPEELLWLWALQLYTVSWGERAWEIISACQSKLVNGRGIFSSSMTVLWFLHLEVLFCFVFLQCTLEEVGKALFQCFRQSISRCLHVSSVWNRCFRFYLIPSWSPG